MTSTISIGLDGAHWELLDPWIADGELPTLAQIREEGVWGDLESCLPPVTCPNWKCYATGKNPGKIGAFWWELVNKDSQTISTVNANTFDSPELWDYLNEGGYSTAIVNMPTTYPPREVDGIMVSGGPDAEPEGYTYPASLQASLKREHNYRLRPEDKGLLPDKKEAILADIQDIIDTRFDVALEMAETHDFVHLTVFYINVLQHFFWRDPVVLQAWKRIDENLARVLETDANVVLMSDHGSNEIEQQFNVNAWLEQEGYLVLEWGASDILSSMGVTIERAKQVFGLLGEGWYSKTKSLIPKAIQEHVPDEGGAVKRAGKAAKVDWDASVALAGGQGPIYMLDDDPTVRRELIEELEAIEAPGMAKGPVKTAYPVEDIYHGDRMEHAPDIVLDQTRGWHIAGAVGRGEVFSEPGEWAAENKRNGLYAMTGPAFADTGEGEQLRILDVTPTLLHLYGLELPESLDGVVPDSVYAAGSEPATSTPEWGADYVRTRSETATSTEATRDRLEDLGYL